MESLVTPSDAQINERSATIGRSQCFGVSGLIYSEWRRKERKLRVWEKELDISPSFMDNTVNGNRKL